MGLKSSVVVSAPFSLIDQGNGRHVTRLSVLVRPVTSEQLEQLVGKVGGFKLLSPANSNVGLEESLLLAVKMIVLVDDAHPRIVRNGEGLSDVTPGDNFRDFELTASNVYRPA